MAARGLARAPVQRAIEASHEELMIRKASEAPHGAERHLLIQDIVYNLSPSLRRLAYASGFELGEKAYAKSGGKFAALESLLENAGLGRMTYTPHEARSLFTSYKVRHGGTMLGIGVHVFESGVIAGYLSAQMSAEIRVAELSCIFNNAPYCQFAASTQETMGHGQISLDQAVNAMHWAVTEKHSVSRPYYMLSLKPLLSGELHEEAVKLMYLLGKHLAAKGALPNTVCNFASSLAFYMGAAAASARAARGGVEVTISFSQETSARSFVDLTTSLLSGYLRASLDMTPRVSVALGSNKAYRAVVAAAEEQIK